MHFSEQINYCFILVLAYNHNIIMDGDAQRGLGIFTQTNTRRHKHKHKHTDVIQARTEHTPPPSHTHTHRHGTQGALLFDAAPPSSLWILFLSFRVSFLPVMRGGLGCRAQPALTEARASPRHRVSCSPKLRP